MRYESEMIPPLKSFLVEEFCLDAVQEEFSAGYGIADIVGVKCNVQKLRYRIDGGFKPVTNIRELSILAILREYGSLGIEELANKVGLTGSYVKNTLLKSLLEKGYVEKNGNRYGLLRDIFYFTDLVVSVEAKLKKWKDALYQAKRYRHFSNIVFVALPRRTIKNINMEMFTKNNIGVLSVDTDSVNIELWPQPMKPRTDVMHLFCNEFFYEKQNALSH